MGREKVKGEEKSGGEKSLPRVVKNIGDVRTGGMWGGG